MTGIMSWIARRPGSSMLLALLVVLAFSGGLPRLGLDTSTEGLLVRGTEEVEYYEETVEIFGEDSILTVVIKSDDIFREEILRAIESLTLDAGAMEGISRVVSLTTVGNLKVEDGLLTDELLASIPSDPEELEEVRRDALSNEILVGEVISEDGKTAALHLFLDTASGGHELEARVVAEVESLLDRQREVLGPRVEMYLLGNPFMKQQVHDTILRDLLVLTPLGTLAVLLTLLLFFRTLSAAVIPALTGLTSVLAALGLMGYLGFEVNNISVMIPVLLVVIGCTEDVHLIAEYGTGLRAGQAKREAVERMAIKSGLAILLTSLTTFVGFMTMSWNPIPALREFGMTAALGILLNFVLTVLLVPPVLRLLPAPSWSKPQETGAPLWLRETVLGLAIHHRRPVAIVSSAVALLALLGALRVVVDTDYLAYFREDSEIRRRYQDVGEHLVGAMPLLVVIDAGEPDAIKDPRVLQDVAEISDFLSERFDKVIGFTDYVRRLHREMNAAEAARSEIPQDPNLISQYTLMLDPDDVDRFVDFDFSRTAILVRGDAVGSRQWRQRRGEIEEFVDANVSRDLDVRVTGEAILVYEASDTISRQLISSVGWVLVAIFIFISLLFSSFKAGLLAMVPNVLPILINFGVMGWMGIPLSVATFPVAVTALGIAVDDTIHFMVRFSKELKETSDNREALTQTLLHELQPVLTTSIALIVGFSMLRFAAFASTRQFGLLAVITMATALVADLVITPALLEARPLVSAWELLQIRISDTVTRTSPLFRGLRPGEVRRVALLGKIARYTADEYILRQGEEGEDIVVILSGEARVEVADEAQGGARKLGKVSEAEVIGEVGYFTKTRRTASVIANGEVEVLRIDGPRLERVEKRFPRVAAKVYYNLSQMLSSRLDVATQRLFEPQPGGLTRPADASGLAE